MNKKKISILSLFFFVLLIILSTTFISICTDHEHDHHGSGGSCATCAQLFTVKRFLENNAFVVIVFALPNIYLLLTAAAHGFCNAMRLFTPVSLKTRMNN